MKWRIPVLYVDDVGWMEDFGGWRLSKGECVVVVLWWDRNYRYGTKMDINLSCRRWCGGDNCFQKIAVSRFAICSSKIWIFEFAPAGGQALEWLILTVCSIVCVEGVQLSMEVPLFESSERLECSSVGWWLMCNNDRRSLFVGAAEPSSFFWGTASRSCISVPVLTL